MHRSAFCQFLFYWKGNWQNAPLCNDLKFCEVSRNSISNRYVQVNLCQKLLFLHQLTHNMTTDCSWNSPHVLPMFCACSFHGNSMNNLLSYCRLVDARIRASDEDLSVHIYFIFDFSNGKEIQPPVMLTNVSFDNLDRDRLLVEDKDANVIDSPVTTTTIASTTSSSGDFSTTGL